MDPIFLRLANKTHTTPEQARTNAAKWGQGAGMDAISAAKAYLREAEPTGEDTDGA